MLYGLFFLFTAKNGNGVSTFTDSLRVAITTEPVGTDGKGTGDGKIIDQSGKNWVASKNGDNYTVPDGSMSIAEKVDYNGTIIHVYIWMEGTDADCVNGKAIENDTTTYDVTVKLAGVATSGQ